MGTISNLTKKKQIVEEKNMIMCKVLKQKSRINTKYRKDEMNIHSKKAPYNYDYDHVGTIFSRCEWVWVWVCSGMVMAIVMDQINFSHALHLPFHHMLMFPHSYAWFLMIMYSPAYEVF